MQINRTQKITVVLIIALVSIAGFVYYQIANFSIDFVGTKNPEYYHHVSQRINFGTVRCDNTKQWDTVQTRINTFFSTNPQYIVPDSLEIGVTTYSGSGWAGTENAIYFEESPKEVYITHFNSISNHIDFVYLLNDTAKVKVMTDTLPTTEKERIKTRLRTEVLNAIDWEIDHIHF